MDSMEISRETAALMECYPAEPRFALAIMQDIQKEHQYISQENLEMLSAYIDVPLAKLYAMATFYRALRLKPRGKHIIKTCDGTACHIKGSQQALECIKRLLSIMPGETTPDGAFTLETVNCMGACAFAPVISIDEQLYAKMNDEKIASVLLSYREGGEGND